MRVSPRLTPDYYLARHLAMWAHRDQTRKDGSMYFEHLCRVAENVEYMMRDDCTERLLVVAFCHDLLEDTVVRTDTIWNLFGEDVYVDCVTLTYDPVNEKRKEYFAQILSDGSDETLIVKLADNTDNLTGSQLVLKAKHIDRYLREREQLIVEIRNRGLLLHAVPRLDSNARVAS